MVGMETAMMILNFCPQTCLQVCLLSPGLKQGLHCLSFVGNQRPGWHDCAARIVPSAAQSQQQRCISGMHPPPVYEQKHCSNVLPQCMPVTWDKQPCTASTAVYACGVQIWVHVCIIWHCILGQNLHWREISQSAQTWSKTTENRSGATIALLSAGDITHSEDAAKGRSLSEIPAPIFSVVVWVLYLTLPL